jgi:predicted DNA-binding transcriptional regulator YafY
MVSVVFQHAVSREIAVRHADRSFQIIQVLRHSTQPVTASQLAVELKVSQRSVYRDVADLIGQRVPIRGEAGIGYVAAPNSNLGAVTNNA